MNTGGVATTAVGTGVATFFVKPLTGTPARLILFCGTNVGGVAVTGVATGEETLVRVGSGFGRAYRKRLGIGT